MEDVASGHGARIDLAGSLLMVHAWRKDESIRVRSCSRKSGPDSDRGEVSEGDECGSLERHVRFEHGGKNGRKDVECCQWARYWSMLEL